MIASGWEASACRNGIGATVPDADVFFLVKRNIKMIVHDADICCFFQKEVIPVPMKRRKIVIVPEMLSKNVRCSVDFA